jgi:hypothetical protein
MQEKIVALTEHYGAEGDFTLSVAADAPDTMLLSYYQRLPIMSLTCCRKCVKAIKNPFKDQRMPTFTLDLAKLDLTRFSSLEFLSL